jgi:hypothetical protein
MLHTLRFSLQNAVYFIMLPFLVHVLFTFYLEVTLKFKCKNSGAKRLSVKWILEKIQKKIQYAIKIEQITIVNSNYKPSKQKKLTLRLLMSYIYGAPILDVSRSHTTTHHSR